jgi:hypothetical protein
MTSEKQHTNSILTINKMPNLQSGSKYKIVPENHGQYAHQNGVFLMNKRHQQEELLGLGWSTQFQTSQVDEHQKRMRITDPSPPTPSTNEELITRSRKPTCHCHSIYKKFFELQYSNHFYCTVGIVKNMFI